MSTLCRKFRVAMLEDGNNYKFNLRQQLGLSKLDFDRVLDWYADNPNCSELQLISQIGFALYFRDELFDLLVIYGKFLKFFFYMVPWLVIAWYFFTQGLAGAPEPEWWQSLERQLGIGW